MLIWSPIHVFWEGEAAVLVFFVISGYVLTISARTGVAHWFGYLPTRAARLAIPAAASVALAFTIALVVPRVPHAERTAWLNGQMIPLTGDLFPGAAALQGPEAVNGPLWSLPYEILFSLALPLFIFGLLRGSRPWRATLTVSATVATITYGEMTGGLGFFYIPVFVLGVLLARHQSHLRQIAQRLPRGVWALLSTTTLLLLTAPWTAAGILGSAPTGTHTLQAVGAMLAVALVLHWRAASRTLGCPALLLAGKYSFSLYLVHMPILLAIASVTPVDAYVTSTLATIALVVPMTWAFHHSVDQPVQRATSRLRRRMTAAFLATVPAASARTGTRQDEPLSK